MRQDIKKAVRPMLFGMGYDEWPYAHGGTVFIVRLQGICYALTCKHVIGDVSSDHILVAADHIPVLGTRFAPVAGIVLINSPENELQEIAIIHFSEEILPDFFGDSIYNIRPDSVGTSDAAHRLKVYGFLSAKTSIDYDAKSITAGYCDLEFHDVGATSSDPFIRQALATYAGDGINSFDGISGAPFFDETEDRLCGMVVRAGINESGGAVLWYIDIFHIVKFVEAVQRKETKLNYIF